MTGPLAGDEVAALLAPVAGTTAIALAVSGGRDSLALLAAVDLWRKAAGRPRVVVLTVDHGLSADSAGVAAGVAAMATARGLPARVLRWPGAKPETGIEAAARRARYGLLCAAARAAGATHLLTAHSREDQAETFLMRLERGSGLFGLAAMRLLVAADGVTLFRPFLAVPRARLAATTAAAGLVPYDDPMNADPRFQRVRVRRRLPALAEAGLGAEAIAVTVARLAEAADAIDAAVDALVDAAVAVDPCAVATVRADAFAEAPAAVRERLFVRLLRAIGGGGYPPRSERLKALLAALAAPARRTLAGVVVERRGDAIRLWREAGRSGLPAIAASPGVSGAWDGRFAYAVAADAPPGLALAPLGALRPEGFVRPRGVPAAALAVTPGLFAGGRLIGMPAVDWGERGGVTLRERVSLRLACPAGFPEAAGSLSVHPAAFSA